MDSADSNEKWELINKEVSKQYSGTFKSFKTIRERTGQIMGFIGVIINLELLAVIQIITGELQVHYTILLLISTFLMAISLITACITYRPIYFKAIPSKECIKDKYLSKTHIELLKKLTEKRIKFIKINKKMLSGREKSFKWCMWLFVLSLIVLLIFIMFNVILLGNLPLYQ
ncbi:hypothetical protein [uncultured Methanobacterium sp.]|uniref:hypothetical protein n=1 Tax=uncultured Methanobacterium sp. TaxID=176306 RepID=UPI002805BFCD|nr:hypothetical protein [uncultured Methanobacterium sp.]